MASFRTTRRLRITCSTCSPRSLRRMGASVNLEVKRPGYVPQGAGVIELSVTPASRELQPLVLIEPGVMREVRGVALASHLAERHVSDRMASVCAEHLAAADLSSSIERVDDTTAQHAGPISPSGRRARPAVVWARIAPGLSAGAPRLSERSSPKPSCRIFGVVRPWIDISRISSCCSPHSLTGRRATSSLARPST